jgi:hypothetical protein
MDTKYFVNPKLVVCEWIPMGVNNLVSLNRHLGSHKKYTAPTAFGMKGEVQNLEDGTFKMESSGCFLQPVHFTISGELKAIIKNHHSDTDAKGLDIDKDGACYIGLEFDRQIEIAHIKDIIGNIETQFASQFLPILTDTQMSLLKCSYGTKDSSKLCESLSSYAMVITDGVGVNITSTQEFLEDESAKNLLTPITDWIIDHYSTNGCHIFIGVKALVCVGVPDAQLCNLLKKVLFQYTLFNISLRLYSTMWANMKILSGMGQTIPNSNYKDLKADNNKLADLQNDFSKHKIVCEQIKKTVESKLNTLEEDISGKKSPLYSNLKKGYLEEVEKSQDRSVLIDQMTIDIQALRDQMQQRMSLIITKNGERLNLTLLVLTIFSVIGIGEVLGFSTDKVLLVTVVLSPFILFVIKGFIQYRKDYKDGK